MGQPPNWYYEKDNKPAGPVSGHKLQRMLNDNELSPQTLVWTETFNEWKKACQIKSFKFESPIIPPPLPYQTAKDPYGELNNLEPDNRKHELTNIDNAITPGLGFTSRKTKRSSERRQKRMSLIYTIPCIIIIVSAVLFILTDSLFNIIPGAFDIAQQAYSSSETRKEMSTQEIIKNNISRVVMLEAVDSEGITKRGSGFLYDDKIVTNYHVIKQAKSVTVTFNDGRKTNADIGAAYDPEKDVAVLDIPYISGLKNTKLGNSVSSKIGDKIVVISSPLGLENSVSEGIISGFRKVDNESLIQFTAPVTHGSSGGALFNIYGEVIAIISSGYEQGNLNFAIPINEAYPMLAGSEAEQ